MLQNNMYDTIFVRKKYMREKYWKYLQQMLVVIFGLYSFG